MDEKTNPFAWSGGRTFYERLDDLLEENARLKAENARLKDALCDTSRKNITEG